MTPSIESDPILCAFLERIASVRPLIKRIVLFGSRARGTHRSDSDYDVLLVVSRKDDALLDVLYDAVMDVLLEHGRLVSLKVFPEREFSRLQSLRSPFMEQVKREGVLIG